MDGVPDPVRHPARRQRGGAVEGGARTARPRFFPGVTVRARPDSGDWLYDEPESLVRRLEYGLRYGNTYPSCLASLA